jgi:hypothetical protein
MKRDGPKAPTAVHGPLGIMYHPNEKSSAIADCLENQFASHDLCDENHERRVETTAPSSKSLERSERYNFTKTQNDPKFPTNLRPINLFTRIDKLFKKAVLKIVERHIEEA